MKLTENNNPLKNGEQESYVQLAEEIVKNGFLYTLIERCEWKAIYAQSYRHSPDYPVAHEIFYVVLRRRSPFKKAKNRVLMEAFPANTDFGKIAWSITRDRVKALERYHKMERREEHE